MFYLTIANASHPWVGVSICLAVCKYARTGSIMIEESTWTTKEYVIWPMYLKHTIERHQDLSRIRL